MMAVVTGDQFHKARHDLSLSHRSAKIDTLIVSPDDDPNIARGDQIIEGVCLFSGDGEHAMNGGTDRAGGILGRLKGPGCRDEYDGGTQQASGYLGLLDSGNPGVICLMTYSKMVCPGMTDTK